MCSQIVHMRPAVPDDRELLERWDEQPHIRQAGIHGWTWEEMLGRQVSWRDLLIAEIGGRPIGFLQIIDPHAEESHYWGECGPGLRAIDIWIGEPDALGKGYGRQMMTQAIGRCFSDPGVAAILIDPMASNTAAHRFYEAMGFTLVGPRRFGPDDCLVYRLARRDRRHGD